MPVVMLAGAGGVDLVVLPDVAAAGLTVDAVVGAGVGFATDVVLVGAGGVDLVVLPDVAAAGL
ncbi:MAG: hypothetical protein ACK5A1_17615, partial [Planctomyces sp.]